jgi:hypothetical protein
MKIKHCPFFILFFFSIVAGAQVTTIKVRKEPPVCDFELTGDSSVFKSRICLQHFSIWGLPNDSEIMPYLKDHYIRPKPLLMTHDSILPNIAKICNLKKYRLKSVNVVMADEKPKIDRYGNAWYYVHVKIFYVEKQGK